MKKNKLIDREDAIQICIRMKVEQGCTKMTILRFLQDECGVSQTSAYEYWKDIISEVTKIYGSDNENLMEERIALVSARLESCIHNKDEKNAVAWCKMLNELEGLTKEEITLNIKTFKANFGTAEDNEETT